ncbi:MAG: hypothetical protein JJ899_10125 [Alphaproteobacteria bacterium]|nr:hypothetical protein [Alphaproteobacteria bacterium]
MRAVFGFTPWESKRLIGKAVAALPEVAYALEHAQIVISHGSTNVYVAEEIMGEMDTRDRYVSGQVINGTLCQTQPEEKPAMLRLVEGRPVPPVPTMEETLAGWDDKSLFIKGANAVDAEFNAGVFNAHHAAGTIGWAYGAICGTGIPLIVPVGLEKLVPSVRAASQELGHAKADYFYGTKIGMLPIMNGKVITEIQAFDILFGLHAVHVGGGGVSGSEGTIVLSVTGEEADVRKAIELVESIKGEPPLKLQKRRCADCFAPPPAFTSGTDAANAVGTVTADEARKIKQCIFSGTAEEDLPDWFRKREPA